MTRNRILWTDDEMELLKPHLLFLKGKGYDVTTALSGRDAIEIVAREPFDLIILDENMPGLTGLEALREIKLLAPLTPVIMITKSEEENIMDQAIGSKIADYLIKPVNPSQILLSIKKILHSGEIVNEHATTNYRQAFAGLSSQIDACNDCESWYRLYTDLTRWGMELAGASDQSLAEMLALQVDEANAAFFKWVRRHYEEWVSAADAPGRPLMSPDIFKRALFPALDGGEKVFLVVVDNFRLDQWLTVKPLLADIFNFEEQLYTSILPTATQYARNAIFSGLMPAEIQRMFPELWVDEDEDEGKNLNEAPLVETQLARFRRRYRFSYSKLNDSLQCEALVRDFNNLLTNDLNIVVVNFIDMLSHARTESRMIRELAQTDAAYRSITESWFRHSPVLELFRRMAASGRRVVLTTDHGTVRVTTPIKVVGDRNTNTNLRYKVGKNLGYNPKQVYEIKRPGHFGLPAPNVSSTYIFAGGRDFFAYPNNYNHYVQYYSGTFQHGGISMEEMLVPLITLTPKIQ